MNDIKKIVLMYPNFKWSDWMSRTAWNLHPYNLGMIASMIGDKYEVSILDANSENLTREEFSNLIREVKPDILGISIITNEYIDSGIIAAGLAKEVNPKIKTVIGGVSTISYPGPFIKSPAVDSLVVGEGEYVFRDLCNFYDGKGDLPKKGVIYKEGDKLINNGRADLIQNLSILPLPAYHLVDFLKYANEIQRESIDRPRAMPYARVMNSRGCPYNCCFCEVGSISGKKPRFRDLESMAREFDWLSEEYGIKGIIFDDDNMLVDKERAKKLLKIMIDKKYNFKWNSPATAVFKIDEEMIGLMKESGCQYLSIAIESGNKRVLKEIIHKPLELDKAKKTINKIKEYGIDLAANFVIGFPGETWEEIRETCKFAEEIDIDYVRIFIATPLPNTALYKVAKEKGYLREGFDFNKHLWTDGWIETPEFRSQDLKILRAYEWDRINFLNKNKKQKIAKMMNITEERLNEIRKETLKRANP